MSDTFDAITLFERADGERSMKFGRHEGRTYLNDDQELKQETAEVVELDGPMTEHTLDNLSAADYPERVREFFGVDGGDDQ